MYRVLHPASNITTPQTLHISSIAYRRGGYQGELHLLRGILFALVASPGCALMLESALLAVELALVAALLIANLAAYLRSGRWINLVVAVLLVLGLLVLVAFRP